MPSLPDVPSPADRAEHLAAVLAALLTRHGPLTFTTEDLQEQLWRKPQFVTTYHSASGTYTLRIKS